MSSLTISLIAFLFIFGGALLGLALHRVLPEPHLSVASKDVVKLGMGLVGTTAALVLGLLVASAKSSYDAQSAEVTQLAAQIAVLDRVLAHYGPETKAARASLREAAGRAIDRMWSQEGRADARTAPQAGGEVLLDNIQALAPKNESQRSLQVQALAITMDLGKTRWLMYAQEGATVSMPLLVVLVLWLMVLFASFGLFAPVNATVVCSLLLSALSVSGAIFLILEMYSPYLGFIQISREPLSVAIANLGR
ncbi:MAG TPA: hypothetical protein VKH64_10400 [Candidatus Binatia bacterium]|nr:hypothetical protein [Candidatus Binatia bacterium]